MRERGPGGCGAAGWCRHCGRTMPDGPDICIGMLPDVAHACCGHGRPGAAYVVLGGLPDQHLPDIVYPEVLRGQLALRYMGLA